MRFADGALKMKGEHNKALQTAGAIAFFSNNFFLSARMLIARRS
jgi:hypothetical protein